MAIASNTAVINWPTPTAEWGVPRRLGVFTASTGGTYLGGSQTGVGAAPEQNATVSAAIGAVQIEIPAGMLSDAGAREAVNGIVDMTLHVSLHTDAAGTTSSNELSGDAYARIAVSAWIVV